MTARELLVTRRGVRRWSRWKYLVPEVSMVASSSPFRYTQSFSHVHTPPDSRYCRRGLLSNPRST